MARTIPSALCATILTLSLLSAASAEELEFQHYMVLPGDSLGSIATQFDVTVDELFEWNERAAAHLDVGAVLRLATPIRFKSRVKTFYQVRHGETLDQVATRFQLTVPQLRWLNESEPLAETPPDGTMLRVYAPVAHRRMGVNFDGRPFHSRISEPTWLPPSFAYVVKNAHAVWGERRTVEILRDAMESVARAFPGTAPFVIGDLSRRFGGRFSPHLSHRKGRDVDIGFPVDDDEERERFSRVNTQTMDAHRTWALVRTLLATGQVEYIFLDSRLQRPLWEFARRQGLSDEALEELFQFPSGRWHKKGVVRHARGHRDHMHIRFRFNRQVVTDETLEELREEPLEPAVRAAGPSIQSPSSGGVASADSVETALY